MDNVVNASNILENNNIKLKLNNNIVNNPFFVNFNKGKTHFYPLVINAIFIFKVRINAALPLRAGYVNYIFKD